MGSDLVSLLASGGSHQPVVVGWGATHSYGPAETRLREDSMWKKKTVSFLRGVG